MNQIIISFEVQKIGDEELAALLENCGYGNAAEYLSVNDFAPKFFCAGTVAAVALIQSDSRIIGFARAFTDDITTTYLAEICVHSDFSRRGLESQLTTAIIKRCGHTAIFTVAFERELAYLAKNSIFPKEKIRACSRKPALIADTKH